MPLPNSINFTAFDPLPASDLNDMVENDEALSDGTAIDALAMNVTAISNPYKFSVYRNAAWTSSSSLAKVSFDTELFDTNNNFASGTYTAPVAGFYHFDASISCGTSNGGVNYNNTAIYKNGSSIKYLGSNTTPAANVNERTGGSVLLQLAASDTIEIWFVNTLAVAGNTGALETWFTGHRVCTT